MLFFFAELALRLKIDFFTSSLSRKPENHENQGTPGAKEAAKKPDRAGKHAPGAKAQSFSSLYGPTKVVP